MHSFNKMAQINSCFLFAFIFICINKPYAQISNDGLLAYYPFSGSVADNGPNGFDGQLFGGQYTSDENGNANSALQLDGVNDYVNLSSLAIPFRENLSEFTIYFKVQFEEFSANQSILSLGNVGESIQTNVFEVEHENNRFQIETETNPNAINNELEIDQSSNLFTNEWIDILIFLEGDNLTYCRNNEEIYKGPYIPSQTLSETLFLGCHGGDNINSCCFFGGKIDELQFYDRIIPCEICLNSPTYSETHMICNNGSITINDIEYSSEGTFEQELQTVEGCDSLILINIEYYDIIDGQESYKGCIGDEYSIEVGNQLFDENNTIGTVLLESKMGCDSIVKINLVFEESPDLLVTSTDISCYGSIDGYILVNAVGGTLNYDYNWSHDPNINTPNQNNLAAGDYTISVTDENNCTSIKSLQIIEPDELLLSIDKITQVGCTGTENGAIEIKINGGTMPFKYDWDNNGLGDIDDQEDLYNLSSGIYNLTVEDANGCILEFTQVLNSSDTIATVETIEICEGEAVIIFGNLESVEGNYSTSFNANNSCDSIHTITLIVNDLPSIMIDAMDVSCYGENDGSISINANGGDGNYTYVWSNDQNLVVEFQKNLPTGNYTITVTDGKQCSSLINQSIQQPDSLIITSSNIIDASCFSALDGSATINIEGGNQPYVYDWSMDGIGDYDDNKDISDLAAGNYSLKILDVNDCIQTHDIYIDQPLKLSANVILQNDICKDDVLAEIKIINVNGGTAPYQYKINNSSYAASPNFTDLSIGNYELSVLDANGCELILDETIQIEFLEIIIDSIQRDPIYAGSLISLILNSSPIPDSISWNPSSELSCNNCLNPNAIVLENTTYTATLFYGDCIELVTFNIEVIDQEINIPNIFSPNGDGINDFFSVYCTDNTLNVKLLQVYDRWGSLIFENKEFSANDQTFGWDGFFNGSRLNPGVFVYLVKVEFATGEIKTFTGSVTLLD